MKIIHTSDWHLGHQLYGYDRKEDHDYFFAQLLDIGRKERPDALVVSGDIFDVSMPSAASVRMFNDFMLLLRQELPEMQIVVISGNHDSASRTDVNRNLWRAAGVNVIGSVRRIDGSYDFSDNVVKIQGKGLIVAVPFVNPAFMGRDDEEMSAGKRFFTIAAEAASAQNKEGLPVVMMSHATIEGCDRRGHRDSAIGKVESMKIDVFGEMFDYVALGHIHKAQNISERIRYCGSPVAISFDEDYPHSVSVVDVEKGSDPVIRVEVLNQKRDLLTFPEEGIPFNEALRKLKKLPADDDSFIRLNIRQEDPLPSDCQELATMAVKGKKCRYCTIKYECSAKREIEAVRDLTPGEFSDITPDALAEMFFGSKGVPEPLAQEYVRMISEIEKKLFMEA